MIYCISGSLSIRRLPAAAAETLDTLISLRASIVVGDAAGADVLAQRYLAERGYRDVTVWHRGTTPRNNLGAWPVRRISGTYTDRDRAMCSAADYGIAIWDGRSPGTARNIRQLGRRMRVLRA